MKKVKALSTIAGSYGLATAGEEINVQDSVAKDLLDAGLVEEVGETKEKETTPKKGSVRFTDETNKVAPVEEKTDPKNATNKKKK